MSGNILQSICMMSNVTRALQSKVSIRGWEKIFREINKALRDTPNARLVLTDAASSMSMGECEALEDFIEQEHPNLQCGIVHQSITKGNLVVHIKSRVVDTTQ